MIEVYFKKKAKKERLNLFIIWRSNFLLYSLRFWHPHSLDDKVPQAWPDFFPSILPAFSGSVGRIIKAFPFT